MKHLKIIVHIWINLWNVEWYLCLKYYADALYLLLLLKRAAIKSHANPTRVTKELRLAGPAFLTYSLSTLSTKTVTFFFQLNHLCQFFLWIPLFFIAFLFQLTLFPGSKLNMINHSQTLKQCLKLVYLVFLLLLFLQITAVRKIKFNCKLFFQRKKFNSIWKLSQV